MGNLLFEDDQTRQEGTLGLLEKRRIPPNVVALNDSDAKVAVEPIRVRLTELLEQLKLPMSALTFILGLSSAGIGIYGIAADDDSAELESGIEGQGLEHSTEVGFLLFGIMSAITALSMNLVDLRRKWLDERMGIIQTENTGLKQRIGELQEIQQQLEAKKVELESLVEKLRDEVANLNEKITKKDGLITEQKHQIEALRSDVTRLQSEVNDLNERLQRFQQYEDATVVVQARATAHAIREMADNFLREAKFLVDGQGAASNGKYILFGVNPDLTATVASIKQQLEVMAAQWLSDELSEEQRAYNERIIAPLLEEFEVIEDMMGSALFRNAYENGLRLQGKIALLLSMNDEDAEEFDSPEEVWKAYVIKEHLPIDWIEDDGGRLINFFEALGVDEVSKWSTDFADEVKHAFYIKCRQYHPDMNPDNPVVAKAKLKVARDAYYALYEKNNAPRYLAAFQKFKTLFDNE